MARITDAIVALARKIKGDDNINANDTASAIELLAEHYQGGTSPATPDSLGCVKQAAAQANSKATTIAATVADFNALLAKLREAGILASEE